MNEQNQVNADTLLLPELWLEIFAYIDSGKTWKVVISTCKHFYTITKPKHLAQSRRFANHLHTLLKMFPNAEWNYDTLSENPNTPFWFILQNLNKLWDWLYVSQGQRTRTIQDVIDHPELPWQYTEMVDSFTLDEVFLLYKLGRVAPSIVEYMNHSKFTFEDIKKYWFVFEFDTDDISKYSRISFDDIKNNPRFSWNYKLIAYNEKIPINDLLANKQLLASGFEYYLSCRSDISIRHLIEHQDIQWHFEIISKNYTNIKYSEFLEYIKEYPHSKWDMEACKHYMKLDPEDIRNIPIHILNYHLRDFSPKDIFATADIGWDWSEVIIYYKIHIADILKYWKDYDQFILIEFAVFTDEDIPKYPQIFTSDDPDIQERINNILMYREDRLTFDRVMANPKVYNFRQLSEMGR